MNTTCIASRFRLLPLAAALLLAACTAHDSRVHGADDFSGAPITVAALLAAPEAHDGQTVVVTGAVAEVCQNKGCWMLLKDGGREVRVTFKDYAFFVPKDCAGSQVEVKGVFAVTQIPAADAAHYLRDAGRNAEADAITGPVPGYTLVATGARFPLP